MQFNTQMPLNIDDTDLTYSMEELPEPKAGFTGMTMSLVEFELSNTLRRALRNWYSIDGETPADVTDVSITQQKEDWVVQGLRRLEQTYLEPPGEGQPDAWVAATQVRVLMASLWLMVFCPTPISEPEAGQSDYLAGKLFLTTIEAIEESNKLSSDPRARQWQWYLRMSLQWHCCVYVLSELGRDAKGALVERAWAAVEEMVRVRFLDDGGGAGRHVLLWQYLRRLLIKARMVRERKFMEDSRLCSAAGVGGFDPIPLDSHPAIDQLLASGDGTR